MSGVTASPTVLVVDDEREVADIYALRLDDDYETRTAYSGPEALEAIDEGIDIVLLDRRMPEVSGDAVLAEIRDRGYDCRVIMLTAINPGPDIVDMAFDDYLCKPIEKDDLVKAIEQQLLVQRHDGRLGEYFELRSKLSLLEPQHPDGSDELEQLRQRAERLEAELEDLLDEHAPDDEFGSPAELEASFDSIDRHPG